MSDTHSSVEQPGLLSKKAYLHGACAADMQMYAYSPVPRSKTRTYSLHDAGFVLLSKRLPHCLKLLAAHADVCTMAGTASPTAAALLAGGREATAGAGKALLRLGPPAGS